MTAPLTGDEAKQYTTIIDGILATADLATISRKKIREGLEIALGGKDLGDQKVAIKDLIVARFDAINSKQDDGGDATSDRDDSPPLKHKRPNTNGHTHHDDDGVDGEIKVSIEQPVKKKVKRESAVEDRDARLAAELQAQENRLARGRTTRGGGTAKPSKPKKKTPKKKSATKVKGDDDSDVDSSEASSNKRKAGGGFQKPFNLSYPLAEVCGEPQLSRPQVVKKLWQHIKANDLQDPTDKRQIRCDEKLQAVFKQTLINMFQMNKVLGSHLYPIEEE